MQFRKQRNRKNLPDPYLNNQHEPDRYAGRAFYFESFGLGWFNPEC